MDDHLPVFVLNGYENLTLFKVIFLYLKCFLFALNVFLIVVVYSYCAGHLRELFTFFKDLDDPELDYLGIVDPSQVRIFHSFFDQSQLNII